MDMQKIIVEERNKEFARRWRDPRCTADVQGIFPRGAWGQHQHRDRHGGPITGCLHYTEEELSVEKDICFGRGRHIQQRRANVAFRTIVSKFQEIYDLAESREGKRQVVANVAKMIEERGFRFFEEMKESPDRKACSVWTNAPQSHIQYKIANSFRSGRKLTKRREERREKRKLRAVLSQRDKCDPAIDTETRDSVPKQDARAGCFQSFMKAPKSSDERKASKPPSSNQVSGPLSNSYVEAVLSESTIDRSSIMGSSEGSISLSFPSAELVQSVFIERDGITSMPMESTTYRKCEEVDLEVLRRETLRRICHSPTPRLPGVIDNTPQVQLEKAFLDRLYSTSYFPIDSKTRQLEAELLHLKALKERMMIELEINHGLALLEQRSKYFPSAFFDGSTSAPMFFGRPCTGLHDKP